jgi:predicted DNA-binding protein (MmcQ/YjbR family)
MIVAEYNAFCRSLPRTTHVVQWGGAHVWKVGGKVFAIAWGDDEDADNLRVTFKCSDLSYDMLKELPGLRPAPYLASRGMKWIQRTGPDTMDDAGLRDYLAESHRIVALGLPKRVQKELGLDQARPPSRSKPASAKKRAARDLPGEAP